MIVCSCNVLSDHQVRTAVGTTERPSTSAIYGCLGCSPQCGRCARTIRRIIDEACGTDEMVDAPIFAAPADRL